MPGYVESVADYFPATNWAHYTAAFDGGSGGQTGFYNVMLHNNDPGFALNWWKASCAWNGVMRQQAADTYAEVAAANDNYRYYIATGRGTRCGNRQGVHRHHGRRAGPGRLGERNENRRPWLVNVQAIRTTCCSRVSVSVVTLPEPLWM